MRTEKIYLTCPRAQIRKKTLHFWKALMTLSLWVTTQEKRCNRGGRWGLVMGPSDLNHFILALQSTVWFFFFCTAFTFTIMFAYTNIKLRVHCINTAPGGDQSILCGRRELACDYNFAIEVILKVDNPIDHREITVFQINLSSSCTSCNPRLPNP